jgi:uncharacterized protein
MVIERSFHIAAPPDAVWALIKDVPRVLPHIPGAQLIESMSNGAHTAGVTLHRGPLQGTYNLGVTVQSLDDQARSAVVRVTAADVAGRGSVDATVTVGVQPAPAGCEISLRADLQGSGVTADLGNGLANAAAPDSANAFVANLERTLGR